MGVLTIRIVWLLVMSCGFAWAQAAPSNPPIGDLAAAVSRVVQGIISYTTWPTARAELRLCVVGQPDYATDLFHAGMQIEGVQIHARRTAIDDSQLGSECDVVYSGTLTDRERDILRNALIGHPVLTISEHDQSCSGSNIFCLAAHGSDVSFAVNLDSIARSGVRVNPRVLLLGRRQRPTP